MQKPTAHRPSTSARAARWSSTATRSASNWATGVAAAVCFYPTGLSDGALGADADAGSLAAAGDIGGRLMIVFGSRDPHVPAPARLEVVQALYAAGLTDLELHVFAGGEHAFMRDVGARYDPELTDLALGTAVAFLKR